ncbi:MAG: TFIIB-type zinc finger domain-containing protein [Pelagimonas sp.]|jgi:ribosomal protein S27E|nr:TFIIB-type zinc finger domain-containing protein [Pelagimonas sp.]
MSQTPPEAPTSDFTEEHRFPCNQCGADFRFAPDSGQLACDHCGATAAITGDGPWDGGATRELDFHAALADQLPQQAMEETRVTQCPNCAAQVEFDPDLHSAECPFCATPVVTDTGTHRHIKPRGLLPFALEERAAHEAMNTWLGSLWFAPNGLQEFARKGRKMTGIYVPYWTFDADTQSTYRGERGDSYTETRQVERDGRMETEEVRKIRWRPAAGRVARFFDDILVLASKSLPKEYTDALQPWDLDQLASYRPEYLAGFRAEGYQIELEAGFQEARQIMDDQIHRDVKRDIGGDRQRVHHVDTQVSDVTFKHVLLPVWMAAYKYRGKSYRFVVNGRTGRVKGERPWSAWKITIAVVLGLIAAAGAAYVISINQ